MVSKRGEGCEYGSLWLVESLLRENLTAVDTAECFEASIRECYPDSVKVLWLDLDPVDIAKEFDPVSWRLAESEWIDQQVSDESLITFDESTYYWTYEVEKMLDES
ncbi:hypothetical protein WDW86_16680 [Bdellovibrionota bacterium FG-2]